MAVSTSLNWSGFKKFVVDASFVLAFLLPDETDLEVDSYFKNYSAGLIDFISTPLLHFEVINGLKSALNQKRITLNESKRRIGELLDYQIDISGVDYLKVFLLSTKLKLTVYDASYLYLSKTQGIPLLTLDKDLKR